MRPDGLGPSTTRVSTLAMENGNVINLQDFEQNEIPLKQRSFEDSIDTFLSLFDADLLMIWMNKFRHGFHFRSASCPVLHIVLIILRGECILSIKIKQRDLLSDSKNVSDLIAYLRLLRITECSVHYRGLTAPPVLAG